MNKKEIWKDIKGFEGLYQVSNLGRVKSLDRLVWSGHTTYVRKSQILCSYKRHKYDRVRLYKNAKGTQISLHRLVAEAFIPNPNNYPMVLHKDDIQSNNKVDNLMWGTQSMNTKQAYENGRKMGFKKLYEKG